MWKTEIVYISKDNLADAKNGFFDSFNREMLSCLVEEDPNADVPPSKPQNLKNGGDLRQFFFKGIPHVRVVYMTFRKDICW